MTRSAPRGAPGDHRPHREVQLILVGLMLGMLLPALTTTIVATALPTILADLGDLSQLSWVVTAYLLAAAVAIPLAGKASDLYGRRPLFQMSVILFVLGSVLCGAARSMTQLVVARGLQGFAAGGLLTLPQASLADVVPPRQRGRYHGYLTSVFTLASVAGPLTGGFLVDHVSWRWVFFANVPIGLAALAVTRLYLPTGGRERVGAPTDWAGAVLVTATVAPLLLLTVWGGERHAWSSPVILSLAAGGALCGLVLGLVERRAPEPVVPLRLFRGPVFTVGVALGFMLTLLLFVAVIFVPAFLQLATGASATASGLVLVPLMCSLLLANIVSGRLISRWGRYRPFPLVGTALLVAGFWLLAAMEPGTGVAGIGARMVPLGLGFGMSMSVAVLAIQNAVPARDLGAATSASQFFRTLGGALGLALFGAVLNHQLSRQVAGRLGASVPAGIDLDRVVRDPAAVEALPEALQAIVRLGLAEAILHAFVLVVPLAGVAFVLALLLREEPLRDHPAPQG